MPLRKVLSLPVVVVVLAVALLLPQNGASQDTAKDPNKYLDEAQRAIDKKDYAQARRIIQVYLKDNPKGLSATPYELLGSAWHREGNLQKARAAFQKGTELAPGSFELHQNLAAVAYQMSDFELAAAAYEAAHKLSKRTDGELLYRAAVSYAKLDRKGDVKRVLDELAGLKIEMQQPWLQLMIQNEVELAEWSDAAKHLQAYLDRFSSDARYWKLLSQVRVKQRNYVAAATALEIYCALAEPARADWEELAGIYFAANVPLQAVRSLEKACGASPSVEESDKLARGYARALVFDRAIEVLNRTIEVQPSPARYLEIGKIHYQNRRWREAIEALNASLQAGGGDGLAQLLIGLSALELGDLDAARQALREAAKDQNYASQATDLLQAIQVN